MIGHGVPEITLCDPPLAPGAQLISWNDLLSNEATKVPPTVRELTSDLVEIQVSSLPHRTTSLVTTTNMGPPPSIVNQTRRATPS